MSLSEIGLPGAIGPEQAEYLTGPDSQVKAVHGATVPPG
jgi:hypothetical protein